MQSSELSPKRQKLFTFFLIITPVIILVLIEGVLRIINYGGDQSLFVTGPEKQISHYWMCNQNVGSRYFFMQKTRPNPPKDLFLKRKPANGYRIFVMGGSTTAGFPYGYNLMFPRILNFMLSDVFPDRYIEVVNTAMSAVNSYTLYDLTDEILAKQPDAILIYAGHNEYYGALGVGSAESLGRNPAIIYAYLKLRRYKTFLLVRDIVGAIRKGVGKATGRGSETDPTNTLMARIVAEQTIPYKSELYELGLRQYEHNLRMILEKAQKNGVPVILSELVSNIKDQPPFISAPADTFPTAAKAWQIGKQLQARGNYKDAGTALTLAKDLDALRFRATEEMNEVIHKLGEEFHVPVAPMKAAFERQCENGLIGHEIILEHLHPNMKGYFTMAGTFFETMQKNNFIAKEWDAARIHPVDYYAKTWGVTELDTAAAALSIRYLKGGWPFQPRNLPNHSLENFRPTTKAESLSVRVLVDKHFSIVVAHVDMAEYFEKKKQYDKAFEEYKAAWYAIPFEMEFYEGAVRNLLKAKRIREAQQVLALASRYGRTPYLDKVKKRLAQAHEKAAPPPADKAYADLLNKARELLGQKKYDEALPWLARAHRIKESHFTGKWIGLINLKNKNLGVAAAFLQKAVELSPDDFESWYNLCNAYIYLGEKEKAQQTLAHMETLRPHFNDPQDLRGRVERLR